MVDIAYDWLNRPISKTYSGPRAGDTATLCYDGEVFNGTACAAPTAPKVAAVNSKMRMTEARNAKSSTQYLDFDAMGRVRKSQQSTGGKDYIFDYTYNAAGAMETMRYPDGRVVTYGIDGMGRVSSVSWGSGVRQVTGLEYEANGALKKMVLGNGATESWQYSPTRWQPRQITVTKPTQPSPEVVLDLKLKYCDAQATAGLRAQQREYSVAGDCGSWDFVCAELPLRPVQSPGVVFGDWARRRGRDIRIRQVRGIVGDRERWESRRAGVGIAITRIGRSAGGGGGGALRSCGNQIKIGAMGLTYDGEGRVSQVTNTGSGAAVFEYDALDRRVKATIGPVVTTFVYDASGAMAVEYGGTPITAAATEFVTADHLGSTRLLTGAAAEVTQRRDYSPYGEELATAGRTVALGYAGVMKDPRVKFTGHYRDTETDLDYFGARFYWAKQGRFVSPDGPLVDQQVEDPQSWNLYGYVRNSPLIHTDPDGRSV